MRVRLLDISAVGNIYNAYIVSTHRKPRDDMPIEAAAHYPSVLEHVNFTFLVSGITRVCSHQLVRHRIASYTQESQRHTEWRIKRSLELLCGFKGDWNDYLECFGIYYHTSRSLEENLDKLYDILVPRPEQIQLPKKYIADAVYNALRNYMECRNAGHPPESCRYLLPQLVLTDIMVTMNLREFLHIYCLRSSPRAQYEIRLLVEEMKKKLEQFIPYMDELIHAYCINWEAGAQWSTAGTRRASKNGSKDSRSGGQ